MEPEKIEALPSVSIFARVNNATTSIATPTPQRAVALQLDDAVAGCVSAAQILGDLKQQPGPMFFQKGAEHHSGMYQYLSQTVYTPAATHAHAQSIVQQVQQLAYPVILLETYKAQQASVSK